ncbi:MAG: lasso peptide biosynthesis B2 protein [Candidatus Rokubacteria bacterium]|nr:lasso peptide biosynthesis B2 protein [Candidatus Rokubacteria bacterium]
MGRLARLLRLSREERVVLVEAWALFLLLEFLLRLLSFTGVLALARRHPRLPPRPSAPSVARLVWLVEVAGRYATPTPTCLKHALVLSWLLRRRGVVTTLRIGVARRGSELGAHAWLEQGGEVVFGDAQRDGYEPLLAVEPEAP